VDKDGKREGVAWDERRQIGWVSIAFPYHLLSLQGKALWEKGTSGNLLPGWEEKLK